MPPALPPSPSPPPNPLSTHTHTRRSFTPIFVMKGSNALSLASTSSKDPRIVNILLRAGADPKGPWDNNNGFAQGMYPLFGACMGSAPKIVDALMVSPTIDAKPSVAKPLIASSLMHDAPCCGWMHRSMTPR